MAQALGGKPAVGQVGVTQESSRTSLNQDNDVGPSTPALLASVGGSTISVEQYKHFCETVATYLNGSLPKPPFSIASPTPGAEEQEGDRKWPPEKPVSRPESLKVNLQAIMASSGFDVDELMEIAKGVSPTTAAATQAPLDAPEVPPAPPTRTGLWAQDNDWTQRSESASKTLAETKPRNYDDDDDDDDDENDDESPLSEGLVNGASPVIITPTDVSAIDNAFNSTTAIAFSGRLKAASIECSVGGAKTAFRAEMFTSSASVADRERVVTSMGSVVRREHYKITREHLDTLSCELTVEDGIARIVEGLLRELILRLEASKYETAKMAATMIADEMDQTKIMIDVANFVRDGTGGLTPVLDTLILVLFSSSVGDLRTKARRHEAKMKAMANYPDVNLVAMQKVQDNMNDVQKEARILGDEVIVVDMNEHLRDLVAPEPPVIFLRLKQIIEEFLAKQGSVSSYKRQELLVRSQHLIEEARRANKNFMNAMSGKGGGGGRVLLANEESQTSGGGEKEPSKEKPRNQGMNGKWKAVQRDLIQPNGICRRQLKMIINRNMTPEDAMAACRALWSERGDEKCKFCESKGAIGKDIIDQARKILGKDEPGSSSAKDE